MSDAPAAASKWWLRAIVILLLAATAALLWAPRAPRNPPVVAARTLDAALHPPPAIRRMLDRSCYDCHSNETRWPWYVHLRPLGWKIRRDVTAGRRVLNFSEWSRVTARDPVLGLSDLNTSCSSMQAGMMPLRFYTFMHPRAKLSTAGVNSFCQWVRAVPFATAPKTP